MTNAFEAIQPYLIQEDFEEYNLKRKEFMASSALNTFRDESPADYIYQFNLDDKYDSGSMSLGRAYHTITLEGIEEYRNRFIWDSPINPTTGNPFGDTSKAYKEWAAQMQVELGCQVISKTQHQTCVDMRIELMKNEAAANILKKGMAERVIRANYCGVQCQIRPDWLSELDGRPTIADLKTTKSLKWFLRDAEWNYGYFNSAAFYRSVSRVVLTQNNLNFEDFRFLLIAQETTPPYKSAVYELSSELLDRHETANQRALKEFRECIKSGVWKSGHEGIELVE